MSRLGPGIAGGKPTTFREMVLSQGDSARVRPALFHVPQADSARKVPVERPARDAWFKGARGTKSKAP